MRKIKEYYNKNRNFVHLTACGLYALYVFSLEVTLGIIPIGAFIMYAITFHYLKKFFSSEEGKRRN